MKVLLVTNESPGQLVGGLGTFVREYAAALRNRAEVRVLLLRLNRPLDPPPSTEGDGVDFVVSVDYHFPSENWEVRLAEGALHILSQIQPLLEDFRPDVIHCNDRHTWMAFRNFRNVVYSFHLSMPDLIGLRGLSEHWLREHRIDQDACARAAALVVYSRFMRDVVWNRVCDFAGPLVLPLGFDPKKYRSEKPTDRIVISFFGRLVQDHKGFLDYLRAVDILPQDLFDRYELEFNLYGQGEVPEGVPLRRIRNRGFLDSEAKIKAYAGSHVVVMPSKYEPFGLVGLEALASGCVLLAPEGLGMDEYLVPGGNFVPIESEATDIATKLEGLLRDPGRYLGQEKALRESVADWTWDRCVREHLKVYHQVVVGRALNMKWAHGRLAEGVRKWWGTVGARRKAGLGEAFERVSQALSPGRILILGATDEEIRACQGPGREIVGHWFVGAEGRVSFPTEYILLPEGSFDTTVFVYGPEFSAHFEFTLQEILRITRGRVILGLATGEVSWAQIGLWDTREKWVTLTAQWKGLDREWGEEIPFVDGFDNRKKVLHLLGFRKRGPEGWEVRDSSPALSPGSAP